MPLITSLCHTEAVRERHAVAAAKQRCCSICSFQLVVRTAIFLKKIVASENIGCLLFNKVANHQLNHLFTQYGNNVKSAHQLSIVINEAVRERQQLLQSSDIVPFQLDEIKNR